MYKLAKLVASSWRTDYSCLIVLYTCLMGARADCALIPKKGLSRSLAGKQNCWIFIQTRPLWRYVLYSRDLLSESLDIPIRVRTYTVDSSLAS